MSVAQFTTWVHADRVRQTGRLTNGRRDDTGCWHATMTMSDVGSEFITSVSRIGTGARNQTAVASGLQTRPERSLPRPDSSPTDQCVSEEQENGMHFAHAKRHASDLVD